MILDFKFSELYFSFQREYTYEKVKSIADWVLERTPLRPKIAIVCGSGLGGLCDKLENPLIIPYSDIPSFPQTTGTWFFKWNLTNNISYALNILFKSSATKVT